MASSLQVGTSPNNLKDLPVEPDKLDWGLNDISSDDAGRVKDAKCTMYKNRIAQKRKIALGWSNPTFAQVSALMRMFAPEYLYVRCKDPLDGGWATHEFYTGDKSSAFRQLALDDPDGSKTVMSSLSFDLIER